MSDDYEIKIERTGKITDEFATKEDKRKAYKIFAYSVVSAFGLTGIMYYILSLYYQFQL